MLEIGNGEFDGSHLREARTHLSLWAIVAAPLMMGTDLSRASPEIIELLKAPEVLAIDQDAAGHQGVIAYADNDRQIIVKTLAGGREGERKAVLLFNRTDGVAPITLTSQHLKMDASAPIALRDLVIRAHASDGSASLRNGSGPSRSRIVATCPSSSAAQAVGPRRSVP